MPMENEYLDHLNGIEEDGKISRKRAVEQICKFQTHLLSDICRSVKVPGFDFTQELRYDTLKKANKDQLCLWLETLIFALNTRVVQVLHEVSREAEKVDELKESKITDQALIINSQKELIVVKDEQVKTLQATVQEEVKLVQSEIKTFSSVLQNEIKSQSTQIQKDVATAISVKKVGEAVKKVVEKEEREKNLVIYGVPEQEESTESLESRIGDILQNVGQKPRIVECCRLGKIQDEATRPVKVTLTTSATVTEVLRNSKLLRCAEGCRKVFICPDRTVEQRKVQKGLVDKLRKKRTENPDTRYRIRNGVVVVCDADNGP